MDKIFIKELIARGIIGVNQWERAVPQEIVISLTMFVDTRPASQSDDVGDTINYSDIAKRALQLAETQKRLTVESLADDIAKLCLEDERVKKVIVRVEKPGAVRFTKSVGVEIERSHSDYWAS
ncbi:MAG: dihydroneopterin aldolase [Anaerolineales bacterium]